MTSRHKSQATSRKFLFLVLSLVSGLLSGLSFNHPWYAFLIWFSLIPLFIVIRKSTYRQAFIYSYLAGFVFFLTGIFWVRFVTKLGLFFLVFYLSFYWALFGLLARKFIHSDKSPLLLAFLWILLEWVRTNFGGFGWALLGYSQYNRILLIQSASLFGVWVVSFVIVYCNVLLSNILLKKHSPPLKKHVFFFLGLFFLLYAYGLASHGHKPQSPAFSISIIQPNIAQYKKWNPVYYREIWDTLFNLASKTPQDSLVVFPEASWPYGVDKENIANVASFVKEADRDMIIGITEEEGRNFYNTSFLFSRDGGILGKYRKINLVPFGEFIPLRRFLSFIEVVNAYGDISAGEEAVVFSYKNSKIATLICFEDIFPRLVSRFVDNGADVLLNITNDAWFKGHPEALQHLQIAVFRAIEQRRFWCGRQIQA